MSCQKLALQRPRERERHFDFGQRTSQRGRRKNIWRHPTVGFCGAHACPLYTPAVVQGMHVQRSLLLDLHTCTDRCTGPSSSLRESIIIMACSSELTLIVKQQYRPFLSSSQHACIIRSYLLVSL